MIISMFLGAHNLPRWDNFHFHSHSSCFSLSSWGGLLLQVDAQERESIKGRLRRIDNISNKEPAYLRRADDGKSRKMTALLGDSDGAEGELWKMYAVEQDRELASYPPVPSPKPTTLSPSSEEPLPRCEDVDCTNPEERCDPLDGVCKLLDSIVPCIAVIDESDNFPDSHFDTQWATFRTDYPDRPFCLLRPLDPLSAQPRLYVPPAFLNDTRTIYANVSRDNEGVNSFVQPVPSDWFSLCGFGIYNESTIEFVGRFVDVSGSMTAVTVSESLALFDRNVASAGLTIRVVSNTQEDWITPFLTTLVPSS